MLDKKLTPSIRLYLIGVAIFMAGLLGAAVIYFTLPDDQGDVLGYEIVDGNAYAIMASDSKMYRHDLEHFGGKAAVFADDLNRWFSGLWKGKRLARTVAVLAIVLALGFFRVGWLLSGKRPGSKDRDG